MKLFTHSFYLSLGILTCSAFGQVGGFDSILEINNSGPIETTHPSLLNVFNDNSNLDTVQNEVDDNVHLEGLATWRSEYLYRGFRIAGSSQETQFSARYIASESTEFDLGIYYGTATGSGDFSEYAGFIAYTKYIGDYTISGKVTLNEHDKSIFRSGATGDIGLTYQFDDRFALKSLVSYDTGADGFYSELKLEYYQEIDKDSYFVFDAGVSATKDYYDTTGFHHAFAQLSYTFNVNESISLTPYVMASLAINDEIEDSLLGGIYFSVSF